MKGVLSLLVAGSNSANFSFTELSSSIEKGNSAGLLAFNVSAVDTVTALAALANQGQRGSRAMTRLSSNFTSLIKKQDQLQDLGIVISDQEGHFLQLTEIVEQFNRVLSDKTPTEQGKILADIFGQNFRAMQILLETGKTGFEELRQGILNSTGALDDLYAAQTKTLQGAEDRFASVKEGILTALGQIVSIPVQDTLNGMSDILETVRAKLQDAADRVTQLFEKFKNEGMDSVSAWIAAVREAIDWEEIFSGMADAAKPVVDAVTKYITEGVYMVKDAIVEILGSLNDIAKQIVKASWDRFIDDQKRDIQKIKDFFGGGKKAIAAAEPTSEATLPTFEEMTSPGTPTETPEQQVATEQEILTAKKQVLDTEISITRAEQETAATSDKILTIQSDLRRGLQDYEAGFQKWLLEPWDKFKQRLLDVKNKFADLIQGLKSTKIDLFEKVGLYDQDEAGAERTKLAQSGLDAMKKRLELAQSPAEKANLQEAIAKQAADLFETTGQSQFQTDTKKYMEQAIRNREAQQKVEERKIQIERDLAEKNVAELTKMKDQVGSAGERVEILSQLSESLMSLGKVDQASAIKDELEQAKREAAGEQVDLLKKIFQQLQLQTKITLAKSEEQISELQNLQEFGPSFDPALAVP
jgi:hypothetical protein